MFFPDDERHDFTQDARIAYLYQNGKPEQKPIQIQLVKNKTTFKTIQQLIKFHSLRIFNSDGAECFQEDLDYIKNKSVLYASKGDEFDPGSCFAEYEIMKLLGEGGFGKVFLAKHKQTSEIFAIKVIKSKNIGSVSDIDAIFIEAEILKSLKHPNIVKVHKCLTLRNMEVVIVMEYLEGGELLKVVEEQKTLSEECAREYFKQIVRAMFYCHQNNLIHRDLKLENLLLVNSEDKKIKIIDFGIAGAISTFNWENLDTGSLGYMAPECFINHKQYKVDGRIDVWATGVILYAMLCGELPFKRQFASETIQMIKSGKFKLPHKIQKTISPQCKDILKRCLDPNYKSRATMAELEDHPWLTNNIIYNEKEEEIQECEEITTEPMVKRPTEKLEDLSNKLHVKIKQQKNVVGKGTKTNMASTKSNLNGSKGSLANEKRRLK